MRPSNYLWILRTVLGCQNTSFYVVIYWVCRFSEVNPIITGLLWLISCAKMEIFAFWSCRTYWIGWNHYSTRCWYSDASILISLFESFFRTFIFVSLCMSPPKWFFPVWWTTWTESASSGHHTHWKYRQYINNNNK